jgi:hypothetical protein
MPGTPCRFRRFGAKSAGAAMGAQRCAANRRYLADSAEQIAADLLAAATDLSADTTVVVVRSVPLALLGAGTTRDHARLNHGANNAEIDLGLTGHHAAGRVANIGAIKIEPNTPHQLGHVRLAEAGVGAARARGRAVEALVDAAQQHVAVKAHRPRMALDDLSDSHVPSDPRGLPPCTGFPGRQDAQRPAGHPG